MSWIKIRNENLNGMVSIGTYSDLDILKKFIKENNIVSFKDSNSIIGTNITDFFKTGGEYGKNYLTINMPYSDHVTIFKTNDGSVIFTSQPYASIDLIRDEVNDWAINHKLKAMFYPDSESWYYPTNTVLIAITLDDSTF